MTYFDIPYAHHNHWIDIIQMVKENYIEGYCENDLLVISNHLFSPIEKIKECYPDHNRVIVYQLEPLVENHWWDIDFIISRIKDVDEVWDYDLDNIEVLKQYGIDAKYKPFIYTEGLKKVENKENPDIDVFFYGTLTPYRCKILQELTNLGLVGKNTVWSYGLYQNKLDEFIGRSKIILDLQTSDDEAVYIQKQSRIFYSLINNKCIVSQKSKKNYFGDLIVETDIENLGKTLDYLLEDDRWKNYSNVSDKFNELKKKKNIIKMNDSISKDYIIKKISEIETAWTDHINFAQWIVEKKKPDVIVDLGVDYAYSTFCFALPEIGHVYGIDSFEGDGHAGTRNTYDYVNQIKNELNFDNITFIKGYFDDIAKSWDKKIDILHIDGFHSYEAVKNDYETWSKFVKDDGIILFHDTCVDNPDFGVKRFFDELQLPKLNFTCSYGLGVVSKNKELIQEIDMVFSITPKNKIAIFYHLFQTDDYEWEKLYHQQINSLIVSGLYDKCDFIHVGINGDKELPFVLDKIKFHYNENRILEANTLQSLWEFCNKNEDYKVFYFHSKGVTHKNNFHCETTTNAWRLYLEYFVIHNWKTCAEDLDKYDCVGPEWVDRNSINNINDLDFVPHFSGNFWWASAKYISTLDLNYLYEKKSVIFNIDVDNDRYRSEFWIGTKNPNYKSYHNSDKLLYNFYYSPEYYAVKTNETISMNPRVFIITPCTRPFYLSKIKESIPEECEWVVVFDSKVKNNYQVENGIIIKSPNTGFRGYPNKNYGLEYIKNNLNPSDNDWIIFLHDDNIIHPNWWDNIKNHLNTEYSIITWGQCFADETPKINPTDAPKVGNIDTSQYMVRWNIAKDLRFNTVFESDGIFAEEVANRGTVLSINEYLGYSNFLRSHKKGNSIRSNICMISMFKNEAKGIRRMLESVWKHIDFYVFQDNGSTDGTPDIVREFFADKNIPGFIYEVEEGWVGFGWNRDHLLQTTLHTDHGCDWIMKMDCDEYLEVDDDFDWYPFFTSDKQGFNVTSMAPGCIYFRTWIWDASLPWKFKHDVAHECIYIDDGVTGENYSTQDLPRGFRMIGTSDGESYTVRTKYISDALKLEEKMIREETMLTDLYHFWYIAKSYHDCYGGDFYPFEKSHSEEFARRAIYYYQHYIDYVKQDGFHEMTYFSKFSIGDLYKYLGEFDKAIEYYNDSEKHCHVRNEHIVRLAFIYNELGQYDKMLEQTTRLMQEDRKLPFPNVCFLLDTNIYHDSGSVPKQLHEVALSKIKEKKNNITINSFNINVNQKPRLWVVDNFYDDPYAVREFALKQEFEENLDYYKGNRSKNQFIVPGTKEAFEKIIGKKITNWTETHGMCGRFQYCTAQDDLVYHCDSQTLAGMIYLTPDAPVSCGTSLFAHKRTGLRNENDFGNVDVFGETGFYDRTKFELVDTAGNVFNRLVLFDAKCIHSANEYFGTHITNSRLFHLFFFD
jgi:tetratricopeptide (TPR) repeat protein